MCYFLNEISALDILLLRQHAVHKSVCVIVLGGVCMHACLGEDLAAAPVKVVDTKGKKTASFSCATIIMASIVPSKQWWVSTWG